jgi:hypothetical protein
VVIPWAAKLKAFNSLSRDHEKITDDATAWAVWIFQLPLSGSRVRGGQKSCARQNGSTPFNSLSRDHGITANLEDASEANCAQAFQLPLSGSLPQGVLSIQQPPSFNSLSRDHRSLYRTGWEAPRPDRLSTPSLGITISSITVVR